MSAEGGDIVITPIMHASVQIEHAGKVIQVDPAMGDYAQAKPADLILVTDIHDDHMNPAIIAKLHKDGAPTVVPDAVRRAGGNRIPAPVEVIANGETKTVAGVGIQAVPMYNVKNLDGGSRSTRRVVETATSSPSAASACTLPATPSACRRSRRSRTSTSRSCP
jgi:L-ascorbate metabolism protein UlaG (beta-lactamase superfamily)